MPLFSSPSEFLAHRRFLQRAEVAVVPVQNEKGTSPSVRLSVCLALGEHVSSCCGGMKWVQSWRKSGMASPVKALGLYMLGAAPYEWTRIRKRPWVSKRDCRLKGSATFIRWVGSMSDEKFFSFPCFSLLSLMCLDCALSLHESL